MTTYRIEVSHSAVYEVTDEYLADLYNLEWEDAQKRGLTLDQFVRESIDIIPIDAFGDDFNEVEPPTWEVDVYATEKASA